MRFLRLRAVHILDSWVAHFSAIFPQWSYVLCSILRSTFNEYLHRLSCNMVSGSNGVIYGVRPMASLGRQGALFLNLYLVLRDYWRIAKVLSHAWAVLGQAWPS